MDKIFGANVDKLPGDYGASINSNPATLCYLLNFAYTGTGS